MSRKKAIPSSLSLRSVQTLASPPLTVLLVGNDDLCRNELEAALATHQYAVLAVLDSTAELLEQIKVTPPNVIIVSLYQPDVPTLEHLASLNATNPTPIVVFAKHGAPDVIEAAVKAGISAYVVDGFDSDRLPSIVQVATARFGERQGLLKELDKTKNQLAERKLIEKAKGILMEQKQLTEAQAHQQLRKMAMNKGETLAVVANQIIEVVQLLQDQPQNG